MNAKLQKAFSHALDGLTTFVIADNHAHARLAFLEMQRQPWFDPVRHFASCNLTNLEISLWPKGQILFRHKDNNSQWDTVTQQVRGYPRGLPVIILNPSASPASSSTRASPSTSSTSDGSSGGHSKH